MKDFVFDARNVEENIEVLKSCNDFGGQTCHDSVHDENSAVDAAALESGSHKQKENGPTH
jgi:hypothetical protein